MNAWLRLGCFLTGWNSKILAQCSEASYKHLKKYTAALLILMILWGFTGFCFAQRYVHAPLWGCILSSVIFITIIVQIERQIILTVGTSKLGVVFRLFIAIIMAFLGSAILDQVIFGEDIKRKMVEITDKQVTELLPVRLKVIDDKLAELQHNIDSLDRMNLVLNDEIAKNPLEVKAYQYDLVINGYESLSGAVRNHEPEMMVELFKLAGYDKSVVENKFPALYNAFSYGAPPHAGSGAGFDRIMMLLTKNEFIRDVIAFPMNKNACDPLTNAPTTVDEKALKDVHIMLRPEVESR